VEKVKSQQVDLDNATRNLHLLSRTWHVLMQDLVDTDVSLQFLEESYRIYNSCFPAALKSYENDSSAYYGRTDDSIRFVRSRLACLERFALNYRDRTNIQINLVRLFPQCRILVANYSSNSSFICLTSKKTE
jgi:hypothetical protein